MPGKLRSGRPFPGASKTKSHASDEVMSIELGLYLHEALRVLELGLEMCETILRQGTDVIRKHKPHASTGTNTNLRARIRLVERPRPTASGHLALHIERANE